MHFPDQAPFFAAVMGGIFIGISAVLLMWLLGRIAGIGGGFNDVLYFIPAMLVGMWLANRLAR